MGDKGSTGRLLPLDRRLRHDRFDLQPHHVKNPRYRSPVDQSLRPALQRDHRLESRADHR